MGLRGPKPKPAAERFEMHIMRVPGGCTEWLGGLYRNGYGRFFAGGDRVNGGALAHRWSYEHFVGPIPDGLDLDHLCRNRWCVNPEHLEPVTRAENIRRAFDRTHCSKGHALTEENTIRKTGTNQRRCRVCRLEKERARAPRKNAARAARRALEPKLPRKVATHCRRGHPLSGDNLYLAPSSTTRRHCRACRRLNHLKNKED